MTTHPVNIAIGLALVWLMGYFEGLSHKPSVKEASEVLSKESIRIRELLKPQRRYIPRG